MVAVGNCRFRAVARRNKEACPPLRDAKLPQPVPREEFKPDLLKQYHCAGTGGHHKRCSCHRAAVRVTVITTLDNNIDLKPCPVHLKGCGHPPIGIEITRPGNTATLGSIVCECNDLLFAGLEAVDPWRRSRADRTTAKATVCPALHPNRCPVRAGRAPWRSRRAA